MRVFWLIFGYVVALAAMTGAAMADNRYALVIGNDAYADVPALELARADAQAVAETLTAQGFEVTALLDGTRRQTNRRISAFTSRLEPGDTAFVFYAGHGVEIDGENYLLPIDIPAPEAGERDFIKSESIALSALLDQIRGTGARTTIAVIDACRDNPFATATGRSIGRTRGLGRINAPEGMFVIFSAGAGQMALDRLSDEDAGTNSVFTRKLLPLLNQEDLELRPLMARLRTEVRDLARTVNHDQVPAYYDELLGQFYFTPAAVRVPVTGDAAGGDTGGGIRADFALARSVGTVEAYDAFLERYGDQEDDFSVQLARQLRDQAAASGAVSKEVARGSQTPEPETVAAVSPPVSGLSRREIIRQTQAQLNELGCRAGPADGISGRRTRAALARFAEAAGLDLGADAIGTQAALDAVTAPGAVSCPVPVAAPAPAPAPPAATPPASGGEAPVQVQAPSLAGTWAFTAKCALFVESKGTVRIRHVSGNFYTGSISDNLGNQGNAEMYLNGRNFTSTEHFPGLVVHSRGRLAADGNSYTASGSNTCSVYARRI